MIVECNVWCINNSPEHVAMGLPEGDAWMPIAIDFSSVVAIKLCGENEFLGNDKAVLYFDSNYVTVDFTYKEAVKIWRRLHEISPERMAELDKMRNDAFMMRGKI